MTQTTILCVAVLLLAAVVGTSLAQGVSCPGEFVAIGEKCYHFSDVTSTWDEARTYCQGLVGAGEGTADLAVLAAHYADFNKIVTYLESGGVTASYWVGLTDANVETEWVWLDGRTESRSSVTWACDKPEDLDTSNCAALFTNTEAYLPVPRIQMHDQSCFSADVYSLCELSPAV